jgi:hypothetical protein
MPRDAAGHRSSALNGTFGACILWAVLVGSCQSAKPKQGAAVGSVAASSHAKASSSSDVEQHLGHGSPAGAAGGGATKVASPAALSAASRPHLTTIRVSAHVGNVIIRREAEGWVISGPGGCTVRSARLERALDNLSALKAVPTKEAVPNGTVFQLQIAALVGEEQAVHLEIADKNATGHLTRLDDDSMVRIQGLDLGLWSPHPADWCKAP